jgi:hypothetical protein
MFVERCGRSNTSPPFAATLFPIWSVDTSLKDDVTVVLIGIFLSWLWFFVRRLKILVFAFASHSLPLQVIWILCSDFLPSRLFWILRFRFASLPGYLNLLLPSRLFSPPFQIIFASLPSYFESYCSDLLPSRLFSPPFQVIFSSLPSYFESYCLDLLSSRLFSPPFQVTLYLTVSIRFSFSFWKDRNLEQGQKKKKFILMCNETHREPIRFRNSAKRLWIFLCSFLGSKLILTNVFRKMWAAATCSGRNGNTRYLCIAWYILIIQYWLRRWPRRFWLFW